VVPVADGDVHAFPVRQAVDDIVEQADADGYGTRVNGEFWPALSHDLRLRQAQVSDAEEVCASRFRYLPDFIFQCHVITLLLIGRPV
jgi:hypothetical protein